LTIPDRALTAGQWILVGLILAGLCVWAHRAINGAPITKDSGQNLRMALNLSHEGILSLDEKAPYRKSMYREPLPVALDAVAVFAWDRLKGPAPTDQYFSGERARALKLPNILWLLLLWGGLFAVTRRFTGSFAGSVVVALFAIKAFLGDDGVNSLDTELAAAALMVLAVFALSLTETTQDHRAPLLAGLCFGLLALTKAAALYVFAATVLVLVAGCAAGLLWRGRPHRWRDLAVMVVPFLVVVAPWMLRNFETFGHAQISGRGGLVLYSRALLDEVNPTEYRGTFYVWARPSWQPHVGRLLGFSSRDLQAGGRLERLNADRDSAFYDMDIAAEAAGRPQDAVSLYRKARAERIRLEDLYERAGDPYPEVAADQAMQHEGMGIVESHWMANLALAVPLIWRSALIVFPVALLVLGYALRARRSPLVLFMIPAVAMLAFYALITHYEPRPTLVVQPIVVVGAAMLVQALWWRFAERRSEGRSARAEAALE
jgi:hypothetical protein